jgi:putative oxidoreductase
MDDLALLTLRAAPGSLLAGHGAQKVFGAFEGPGPQGTRGFMQAMRMRPPEIWAHLAGLTELVGGGLTALGALSPIGPLMSIGPMVIATTTAHWGKPIWATRGGAELPVVNMSIFAALAMTGPGRYSIDGLFGIRLPRWVTAATIGGVATGTVVALVTRAPAAPPAPAYQPTPEEALAAAAAASDEREVELQATRHRREVEAERPA